MERLLALIVAFLAAYGAPVEGAGLSIVPEPVAQGGTVLVRLTGVASPDSVVSFTYGGEPVRTMTVRDGEVVGVIGIDLRRPTGTVPVRAVLRNGTTLIGTSTVTELTKPEVAFEIPESLGGTTSEAAKTLLATLASENAVLAGLWTNPKVLWKTPFRDPVEAPTVTDGYGYTRSTAGALVAHKGTDFRAPVGTPVYAMNRGVVRLVRTFRNYGKTVVVDHGQGVQTLYMHLSRVLVGEGTLVSPGQLIARSGDTGYTLGAHLHVSVRVRGISVDPERFLALWR